MGRKPKMTTAERKQAAMLAADGRSPFTIGKIMGRDHKTVAKVLREPNVMALVADNQERLAAKYEQLAESILDNVTYEDFEKATLQQKAISSGTFLDKARLIRGASTQNLAVVIASACRTSLDEEESSS